MCCPRSCAGAASPSTRSLPARPAPGCSCRARPRNRSSNSPSSRRWSGSVSPPISPRRSRRQLDQRPGAARQWRDHLIPPSSNTSKSPNIQESPMKKVVLITCASSGFGRLTAEALAMAGHVVYGSMRQIKTRNAPAAAQMATFSRANNVDLRALELDVQSQDSVDAAVAQVIAEMGWIDVLIHNAGHMVFGPAEAFTPEQYASLYDVNVLSTQRVNRAVLPHMRKAGEGLVVWVSSSSSAG